jgi:proton glutamate symport protein
MAKLPSEPGVVAVDEPVPDRASARPAWLPGLTTQIFIGLVVGIVLGTIPGVGKAIKPLADVFLHMIRMIIAPLIFSTLVVGIAGMGDFKAMGRVGIKALIYFEVATTLALLIGLAMVNVLQPGSGLPPGVISTAAAAAHTDAAKLQSYVGQQQGGWDIVLHAFPTSVIDSMAKGDILQIVVFSTFFGIALAAIGRKGQPVIDLLDAVAQTMFKFTGYVMLFAPIGVTAAIAYTVDTGGLAVLIPLAKLVGSLYVGLAIFVTTIILTVSWLVRISPWAFVRQIREPCLIAFTTASSEAALPKAMVAMEKFGVPRNIVGFVMPTGYSFNLDGSVLYLSLASVFVAQIAGIPLTIGQQILMMLTLMLTSKGVAGVPRAAIVVLMGTLNTFNLPLEAAAILLGVDQILDMGRTAVNVMGNCMATVVVARWEGVLADQPVQAGVTT